MKPQKRRATGGSASSKHVASSSSRFGFFKTPYTVPGQKTTAYGRILPAFDASMSPEDKAFKESFMAYRDENLGQDSDSKTVAFTPWYSMIYCYRFFGNAWEDILSPMTMRLLFPEDTTAEECADPIADCRTFAESLARKGDEAMAALVKKPENMKDDYALPQYDVKAVMNVYMKEGKYEMANRLLILSQSALKYAKTRLAAPCTRNMDPRDKNWEDYMLGDITDPMTGLKFKIETVEDANLTLVVPSFSDDLYSLDGSEPMVVSKKVLADRVDLQELSNFNIPTYQDLVDFLVFDGMIPVELIKRACSYMADVGGSMATGDSKPLVQKSPEVKPAADPTTLEDVTYDDSVGTANEEPEAPEAPEEPESPEPPEEPDEAPTPPEEEEEEAPAPPPEPEIVLEYFWVYRKAEGTKKLERAEIEEILGTPGMKMMPEDKSTGWLEASEFGFGAEEAKAEEAPKKEAPAPKAKPVATKAKVEKKETPVATEKQEDTEGGDGIEIPAHLTSQEDKDRFVVLQKKMNAGANLEDAEMEELVLLVQPA